MRGRQCRPGPHGCPLRPGVRDPRRHPGVGRRVANAIAFGANNYLFKPGQRHRHHAPRESDPCAGPGYRPRRRHRRDEISSGPTTWIDSHASDAELLVRQRGRDPPVAPGAAECRRDGRAALRDRSGARAGPIRRAAGVPAQWALGADVACDRGTGGADAADAPPDAGARNRHRCGGRGSPVQRRGGAPRAV